MNVFLKHKMSPRQFPQVSGLSLFPQILIVTSTAFAGVLLLNYQRDYAEWLLPLIIVCLFSFLVAHCFLSIFEIVVDVLFLCFAIDTKYNDGTPGKEFFMDKALMVRQQRTKHNSFPSFEPECSSGCRNL